MKKQISKTSIILWTLLIASIFVNEIYYKYAFTVKDSLHNFSVYSLAGMSLSEGDLGGTVKYLTQENGFIDEIVMFLGLLSILTISVRAARRKNKVPMLPTSSL